jgi:Matrixin
MAYLTDGRIWPASTCLLDIAGPNWPAQWQPHAQAAMDTWNASGARFTFAATPGAPDVLAAYDLGAWNGWIAMTYIAPQGSQSPITGVQMLVNLHYEWSPAHPTVAHTDPGGAYDLESVLTHELGHYLHLNDEQTAQDVMQPTITPGVLRRTLGVDDINGAQYLYPMLAQFSVAQLANQAELVIRGRVEATRIAVIERFLPLGPGGQSSTVNLMFTVHRVNILEQLRGTANRNTIDVLTLGGETSERSFLVDSEAALYPREEVILFLSKDHERLVPGRNAIDGRYRPKLPHISPNDEKPVDAYSVYGAFQGKYTIYRQANTDFVLRQNDHRPAPERTTLEELRAQIRGEEFLSR